MTAMFFFASTVTTKRVILRFTNQLHQFTECLHQSDGEERKKVILKKVLSVKDILLTLKICSFRKF